MNSDKNTLDPAFILDIRNMLDQARQKAYAAVNSFMVEAYWHIGRRIVEEEQQGKERAEYGTLTGRELSKSLWGPEFGKDLELANSNELPPVLPNFS